MNKPRHSPGPWHAIEYFKDEAHKKAKLSDAWVIVDSAKRSADDGKFIAQTYTAANAKLIAAAPELLTWAQDIVSRIEALESVMVTLGFEGAKSVEHLKAAIAKATGEK